MGSLSWIIKMGLNTITCNPETEAGRDLTAQAEVETAV